MRAVLVSAAQILGGLAAAGLVSGLFPGPLKVSTSLRPGTSVAQGLFIEMFLTAELVFVIIMLAAERHRSTHMAPVGIGIAFFVTQLTGSFSFFFFFFSLSPLLCLSSISSSFPLLSLPHSPWVPSPNRILVKDKQRSANHHPGTRRLPDRRLPQPGPQLRSRRGDGRRRRRRRLPHLPLDLLGRPAAGRGASGRVLRAAEAAEVPGVQPGPGLGGHGEAAPGPGAAPASSEWGWS